MRMIARTRSRTGPPGRATRRSLALSARRVGVAFLAAVVLSMLSADPAYAQAKSVHDVLSNIQAWLTGISAALATVFLMIGGARYTVAGGDPGEVEKAKTAFKAAGIGYLLAVLAPVVLSVLKTFAGLN